MDTIVRAWGAGKNKKACLDLGLRVASTPGLDNAGIDRPAQALVGLRGSTIMSGETSRMMALCRLGIAACRKSPVCQCSAATSGGLELCSERARKVFDNISLPSIGWQ